MDEILTDRLSAKTLDEAIIAVEAWKAAHPDWVVAKVHYFATFNDAFRTESDGWAVRIDAKRRKQTPDN